MMAKVGIPNSFFVKSRKEYTDWTYAWWREAFQNSTDALCTAIDIQIGLQGSDKIVITFADNGTGMTEDVLLNGLLQMGGSVKLDGATGGFGYAKTLLFFANDSYVIRTKDMLVQGSGGDYELEHQKGSIEGTVVQVTISDGDHGNVILAERFMRSFQLFCANYSTYLRSEPLTVTMNGKKVSLYQPENGSNGFHTLQTELGELYFDDRDQSTRETILWVLINGIPMFNMALYSDKPLLAYLELDAKSTDVLTSNRDNLVPTVQRKVQDLLTQLTMNSTALKAKPGLDFIVNRVSGEHRVTYANTVSQVSMVPAFEIQAAKKREQMEEKLNKWLSKIDTNMYPENFRFVVQGDEEAASYRYCVTQKAARLASIWKTAVCSALDAMYEANEDHMYRGRQLEFHNDADGSDWYHGKGYYTLDGLPIHYGFVFRSDVEALYSKGSEAITILVNPLTLREDATSGILGGDILDRAIHELAHAWEAYHNETYVGVYERIREDIRRVYTEAQIEQYGKEAFRFKKQPEEMETES